MTEGERREDGWLSELAALTRAATPERREDGWEELRREIEALQTPWLVIAKPSYVHGWRVAMDHVLAIVDRLAAAPPPEPAIDVERLARAMADVSATPGAGWGNGNSWDDLTSVGKEHRREQAEAVAAEYDRLGSE